MKLIDRLEKAKEFWFLIFVLLVFFLLRLPSLFEPYWYGDEGIYQVIGISLEQGRLLYRDIWDNKPPLLYLVYFLFSSDQFALRSASLVFGLLSTIAFFFLAKQLFPSQRKSIFLSVFLFAILFATPFLEGNIANAENFMLLPILLSAVLVFSAPPLRNKMTLSLAGILLSLAFLFKAVSVFDFLAFFFFLFVFSEDKKSLLLRMKEIAPLVFGFALPVAFTAGFFLIQGIFWDFFNAAFRQMVGYVGYGNRFIIGQGLLFLKLILLTAFLGFIFLKRNVFSKTALFILIWLAFSLFNALFAQRPYTHYLLVLLPSFLLFFGLIIRGNFFREGVFIAGQAKNTRGATLVLFVLLIFLIFSNFRFYTKIIPYYQNFIAFTLGKKSVTDYRAFFDRNTPRDYAISEFLKMNMKEKDEVFIWGNNAQVYKLVGKPPPGRFTVAYHITATPLTIEETKIVLQRKQPRFIVVMPKQALIPYSLTVYSLRFVIDEVLIYEKTF